MFVFNVSPLVPVGFRSHHRRGVLKPKIFPSETKRGTVPFERGNTGKIATETYPATRDKHDFYMTYTEGSPATDPMTDEPLRRKWNERLDGILPVAIRYRWNRQEERIDSAFMVTPDGKSKFEIDEKGGFTPYLTIHPEGFGITGHFTPSEGKWSLSIDDPRLKLDAFILAKQLQLFLAHYNDNKARFEITGRYKTGGAACFN